MLLLDILWIFPMLQISLIAKKFQSSLNCAICTKISYTKIANYFRVGLGQFTVSLLVPFKTKKRNGEIHIFYYFNKYK